MWNKLKKVIRNFLGLDFQPKWKPAEIADVAENYIFDVSNEDANIEFDKTYISKISKMSVPEGVSYFKDTEFYNTKDTWLTDKTMDPELIRMLNLARHIDGKAWKVNSGKRSKEYNAQVGGVASSAHITGKAVDISATTGIRKFEVVTAAYLAGFNRIGINKSFIHLDVDNSKPNPSIFLY